MDRNMGASADAETGSRADASSPAVSTEGFDPARIANLAHRLSDLERRAMMHLSRAVNTYSPPSPRKNDG